MTEQRKMPPLGSGSIDLDALHAADRAGKDLQKAIDAARFDESLPELTGRETLADLEKIAERLSIDPEDGWQKKDFAAAVDAKLNPPTVQELAAQAEADAAEAASEPAPAGDAA